MADRSADRDVGGGPERDAGAGTPRWVKVFGIIALVVVVLFLILVVTGGPGRHGPGRHIGGVGDYTSPASVSAPGPLR
jgi:hypothetical protein